MKRSDKAMRLQSWYLHILSNPSFSGPGNRYVQTHESSGRPQDHGGDQEGGRVWCSLAGQLHWQNTGMY